MIVVKRQCIMVLKKVKAARGDLYLMRGSYLSYFSYI